MLHPNKYYRRRGTAVLLPLWGIICISVFTWSCNTQTNKTTATTPSFDSAINRAARTYDSGFKTKALNMAFAAHATEKDITAADEMNYFTFCGEIYRKDFHDGNKYEAYADSMLQVLEKNGLGKSMPDKYILAVNMKADALFAKGLYTASYNYYYKAKKLAGDTHDSCSLAQYSYSLGMVLYRQQRYGEAANNFIAAFDESRLCTDNFVYFYRRQELLDNVGLCFYHSQKYDSAMLYYKRAISCIESNYMRFDKRESVYISAKAVVYGNMADLYTELKKYDTATTLLQKSILINLQKGYTNSDAIIDQAKLGSLYLSNNDYNDLKPLLADIKGELDTIPNKQVEMSLNKLEWKYYDHAHQNDSAYKYLAAYVSLSDSLAAYNKTLMASDVDGTIKSLERQYQITLLNKNTAEERIYLAVATVILLMAIIIILMAMRNMKRTRKNVATLTTLNKQVNEQKEALQKALTELEVKDVDKSRVLRAAAHDVLNPIAAISGLVDILKFDANNFNEEQKEILNLIKETCENSISLSRDILEAATAADKTSLHKEWVNINKLLTSSIDLLGARAAKKHQRLLFTSNNDNIEAFVHKEKIWRVINNLVGNAIKFSYENSEIEIAALLNAGKVTVSVKDHGIGIPEKNKKYIFNVFSQARMAGTAGEAAHGLGLSISIQIAKAHDGNIWFESEEGKGTTFYFEFPVKAD